MTADFISDVSVASPQVCKRRHDKLASRELLGDIMGTDEQTLFQFRKGGGEPVIATLGAAFGQGKLQPPAELGATYVDVEWTDDNELRDEAQHLSSNYAALVVLDRAIAIPRGVTLLAGHALRHVRNADLDAFQRDWRGLLLRGGGTKGLARQCRPWLDRGDLDLDELAEFIEAIGRLAALARAEADDLLLACCAA